MIRGKKGGRNKRKKNTRLEKAKTQANKDCCRRRRRRRPKIFLIEKKTRGTKTGYAMVARIGKKQTHTHTHAHDAQVLDVWMIVMK